MDKNKPLTFEDKIQYVSTSFNLAFYYAIAGTFNYSFSYADALALAYAQKNKEKIRLTIGEVFSRLLELKKEDFPDIPDKPFEELELFTLTNNGINAVTIEVPGCKYESQCKYISLVWPDTDIHNRRVYSAGLFESTNNLGLCLKTKRGHYTLNTMMDLDVSIEDFTAIAINDFSSVYMFETKDINGPIKV